MSTRAYAVNDYGLVMTRDMLKVICEKYFTGDATVIDDNGNDMYEDYEAYYADTIYYAATEKFPSLFKTAYSSMDELESEFKNKFNRYFPEDFDYRKHICHIVGTYFC